MIIEQYSNEITQYALQNSYFSGVIAQFQQHTAVGIMFDFDDHLKYDMQNSTNLVLFHRV